MLLAKIAASEPSTFRGSLKQKPGVFRPVYPAVRNRASNEADLIKRRAVRAARPGTARMQTQWVTWYLTHKRCSVPAGMVTTFSAAFALSTQSIRK